MTKSEIHVHVYCWFPFVSYCLLWLLIFTKFYGAYIQIIEQKAEEICYRSNMYIRESAPLNQSISSQIVWESRELDCRLQSGQRPDICCYHNLPTVIFGGDIEANPGPSHKITRKIKIVRKARYVVAAAKRKIEIRYYYRVCHCRVSVHYKCEVGCFGVDITNWKCTLRELPKLYIYTGCIKKNWTNLKSLSTSQSGSKYEVFD